MTDDLNKQWAELEGWKVGQKSPFGSGWITPKTKQFLTYLPDWTEPNRFFAEVVPRIHELEFVVRLNDREDGWVCSIWTFKGKRIGNFNGKTIGIAGLTAAIQARKELGK